MRHRLEEKHDHRQLWIAINGVDRGGEELILEAFCHWKTRFYLGHGQCDDLTIIFTLDAVCILNGPILIPNCVSFHGAN